MEYRDNFHCPSCNYETSLRDIAENGSFSVVQRMVCKNCKELMDVELKQIDTLLIAIKKSWKDWLLFRQRYTKQFVFDYEDTHCRDCNSLLTEIWDSEKCLCPVCRAKMKCTRERSHCGRPFFEDPVKLAISYKRKQVDR
jgi:hypothetical protein